MKVTFSICLFYFLIINNIYSQKIKLVDDYFIQNCQCKKYKISFPNEDYFQLNYSGPNGNTIKSERYDKGSLASVDSFVYDKETNLLVAFANFSNYDSTLNYEEGYFYKYSKDKKLTEVIQYNREGEKSYKTIYFRDSKGRIDQIKEYFVNKDSLILQMELKSKSINDSILTFEYTNKNKMKYYGKWKFNIKNEIVEEIIYNKLKKEIVKFKFEYDSIGNQIKATKLFEKEMALINFYPHYRNLFWPLNKIKNDFDSKGRLIKVTHFYQKKEMSPFSYNIEYYE